jgi:hypothetical protein
MLIGMGDYGVLWVMRYEHARQKGQGVREALLHTTTHVAVGNLTAASTLALAFYAAIFADFKAVAELGWIAGSGVLLCAFACFTVLPALLILFDRRESLRETRKIAEFRDAWLPILQKRPGLVLSFCLLLTLVVGLGAFRVGYDHNLLHLQAENLDSVKWEMTLIRHTAGASWHSLSYTKTREEALALKAKFEALPDVSRVVEVASMVPPDQEPKLPMVAQIRKRLAYLPERGAMLTHLAPDVDQLQKDLLRLHELLARQVDNRPLFAELQREVTQLRQTLAQTKPALARKRLKQFDQRVTADLAENLYLLRDIATPEPITLDDLPPALRERYVGKSETWLLRVFAKEDLWNFQPLEDFTKKIHSIDPHATGKPFGTVEGLKAMKNGLIRAGIYAFLVIVLILWIDFRTLGRTLLAVLPLLVGVVLSVGVLGWLGLPLNPANMIAFPLILGVGVDNGVHVLHDWLIRRREGQAGISKAIGRGVAVKAMTTMMGFGTLMISTERGLASLGFILTLGVGASMLAALVLLPAALQLLGNPGQKERSGQQLAEAA